MRLPIGNSGLTNAPFGRALLLIRADAEERLQSIEGIERTHLVVLLSASAGAAVALGEYGSILIAREHDAAEELPTETGELIIDRIAEFAHTIEAHRSAVQAAYRVLTWALVAELAVFYWRPDYELEISRCAEAFGFDNIFETTIAGIGEPGADKSLEAEAARRDELVKGSLVCMIAGALDQQIDPDDPMVSLAVEGWATHFEQGGIDTARERLLQLSPDGLPIWKPTPSGKDFSAGG